MELTVFAAASLTESLNAIAEKYMAKNQNMKLSFNFDSSGKLLTQIKEGAPCDLFISAAPKQMNELDSTLKDDADKNPEGLNLLVPDSRLDLLENKVVLAVADGSDKNIDSFDKLAELLKDYGGPILWVSHDLGECCRNCRTVCVMENGVSAPVTDMVSLVRHPATVGAARLAGCHNFLTGNRCPEGVHLDGWELTLPLRAEADNVTIAVPDHAVTLFSGAYQARVYRVIQDLNATVVVLQAPHAPDAPTLRIALPDCADVAEGDVIAFALRADQCLQWAQETV